MCVATNLTSEIIVGKVKSAVTGIVSVALKVALQILGRKFKKDTKISSLYSQSLLIFIHKTPVVKNYLTTGEIKELLWPRSTLMGIMIYFYMSSSLISMLEIHRRKFHT